MTFLRAHWLTLATMAAGVLILLRLIGLRPFALIPTDAVVLYIGECPAAYRTVAKLAVNSQFLDLDIAPVPVDEGSMPRTCPLALQRLHSWSPLLRLLPDSVACRRLKEDAAAFHRRHLNGFPALSVGGVPVPAIADDVVLAEFGVEQQIDEHGGREFSRRTTTPDSADPASTGRIAKQLAHGVASIAGY